MWKLELRSDKGLRRNECLFEVRIGKTILWLALNCWDGTPHGQQNRNLKRAGCAARIRRVQLGVTRNPYTIPLVYH